MAKSSTIFIEVESFMHPSSNKSAQLQELNHERRHCRRWSDIDSLTVPSILAIFSLTLLSSCITPLSQSDCNSIDWYDKGLADGESGRSWETFGRYVEDCSRFAVTPDREDYSVGRERGLESYCTKERGYEVGLSGQEYLSVCPESQELDFHSGYDPGKRLHHAEQEVKSINSSISKLKGTIVDLEREIEEIEMLLLNGRPDEQERPTLERQIRGRQKELVESQLEIVEYSNMLEDVMATYRDTVHELKDLGFAVVEKY